MTIAEDSQTVVGDLRRICYDAVATVPEENISLIVDNVFDIVTATIRNHFSIGINDAELVLRDARNEAERLISGDRFDDLVNLRDVVDAIAQHLAEEEIQ